MGLNKGHGGTETESRPRHSRRRGRLPKDTKIMQDRTREALLCPL